MVIWIDGTFGVGKSKAAAELVELFALENPMVLNSDEEWFSFIERGYPGGGCFPQNNSDFICRFRRCILDCLKASNLVIVDMALTDDMCKTGLLEQLLAEGADVVHFVLDASDQVIEERISNDELREQKDDHIRKIARNREFLRKNFKDAIWLDTEKCSPADRMFQIVTNLRK